MHETVFYLDPEFWVAVSFALFAVLFAKPGLRSLNAVLDSRSKMIEQELAEAKRLRQEAETLLNSYKKQQIDFVTESETLLASAAKEAKSMSGQAESQATILLDKRMKLALDKIAQAESKALQEVQEHVADIAVSVARSLIMEHVKRTGDVDVVKQAAAQLERKLH